MNPEDERRQNQAAYRQLRDSLARNYPPGRFLAISNGQVVADAGRFDELRAALTTMGQDPSRVLIVQAGAAYPETAVIFSQAWRL